MFGFYLIDLLPPRVYPFAIGFLGKLSSAWDPRRRGKQLMSGDWYRSRNFWAEVSSAVSVLIYENCGLKGRSKNRRNMEAFLLRWHSFRDVRLSFFGPNRRAGSIPVDQTINYGRSRWCNYPTACTLSALMDRTSSLTHPTRSAIKDFLRTGEIY